MRVEFPYIIGITGSMGVGKSTVTHLLATAFGWPFWDADEVSKRLIVHDPVVRHHLYQAFPCCFSTTGDFDRQKMRHLILENPHYIETLEQIIHPRLKTMREKFYQTCRHYNQKIGMIDVPLLFEGGVNKECHDIFVVTAPQRLQKQRILQRPGMTEALMITLRARQWPSWQKEKWSSLVLPTGIGKRVVLNKVRDFFTTRVEGPWSSYFS